MGIISIDIGGSKIIFAKIVKNKVIKKTEILKFSKTNKNKLLETLKENIIKLDKKPSAVCIGVPSIIDNGKCIEPQNIKSLNGLNLKKILEKEFPTKVYLSNDSNCFALGEYYFGKAKNYSSAVCITIGTGISAGIIINKKLLLGKSFGAGEIGRIPYNNKEEIEDLCSSKFFLKTKLTGEEVYKLAENGNKNAKLIFNKFGQNLGIVISTIINIINPDVIVLGGRIAKSRRYFEKEMYAYAKKFTYNKTFKETKIVFSDNKNSSLLGAALLPKLKE